jgi:ABC-type antimicrobial peptide transport system permease subunit
MDSDANAPWLTVVGVVGRIKQYTLDERDSRIAMYHPHTQNPSRAMNVVVRAGTEPAALTSAATAAVRALDPDLPIYNVKTMEARVDESLARRRFAMLLLALFAALALGLASVGVYGVMSFLVNQGTREIGIRLALGASPGGILVMIVRHGVTVALIGIAIGLGGAVLVARAMENLLFGVGATDVATFVTVCLVLLSVAAIGSYMPARRAARIDPAISLRTE